MKKQDISSTTSLTQEIESSQKIRTPPTKYIPKNFEPLQQDEIIPGDEKTLFYLELLKPELGDAPFKNLENPSFFTLIRQKISKLFKILHETKLTPNTIQSNGDETLSWITKNEADIEMMEIESGMSLPRISFNDSLTASLGEFGVSFSYTQSWETTGDKRISKESGVGIGNEFKTEHCFKKQGEKEIVELESNHDGSNQILEENGSSFVYDDKSNKVNEGNHLHLN
jgi:hypothetical protein